MTANEPARRGTGFTLIELVVVTALMVVAVGVAALRLDDFSDTASLRSAASQIERILRLAQAEARFSGEPRLCEYAAAEDVVRLRRPIQSDGLWDWGPGRAFSLSTRVQVAEVVGTQVGDPPRVRIAADGYFLQHAVILQRHARYAVLLLDSHEPLRNVLMDRPPLNGSLEAVLAEVAAAEGTADE